MAARKDLPEAPAAEQEESLWVEELTRSTRRFVRHVHSPELVWVLEELDLLFEKSRANAQATRALIAECRSTRGASQAMRTATRQRRRGSLAGQQPGD